MRGILSTDMLSVEIAGKRVCHNLDLQIQAGECWAMLGMNGVGKTTLLHSLAGLRPVESGTVKLHGQALQQLGKKQIAQSIAVLLQDYEDSFPGTVMQTVLTGRHPHLNNWQWESSQDLAIAEQALKFVAMEDFAERSILSLSGGERRRVAIATLLCQQAALYMLDEPANHLDLRFQHQILADLSAHVKSNDKASLMIMHDVNLATRYCDHALLLFGNGEVLQGTCAEVISGETISRLYDYPMRSITSDERELIIPL